MTIEAHSLIADFYKGRPPYTVEFFGSTVQKLAITRDSVLLDLCCGRGELASGFAPFCKAVYAVDGSRQMLNNSIARPNVSYLLHDVNKEEFALPQAVDHIVIGSAIHWVEPGSLAKLIERKVKPGGKVLVTHTLMKLQDQPWHAALEQLNAGYGKAPTKSFKDLQGADRLQACGFGPVDLVRTEVPVQFGVEYLYRSQLSYLYSVFYEQVVQDLQGYRKRIADAVAPHLDAGGKLSGTLINWGVVFARVGQAA